MPGESYKAYIPKPLPPNPPLQMREIYPLLVQANIAIGRLDGMSLILPEPSLLLYMYIRKEAVLSSQIEGTQSSLSDLLLFENQEFPGVPNNKEVIEVADYVAAMEHGLRRVREHFSLSLRLIKEMHEILLKRGRGSFKQPGEIRRSQNWIGGSRLGNARFVPPPAEEVRELLGQLEKFLHSKKSRMPVLVKAALAHVQFETIHPFLDGNGRLGRLLITFILCSEGVITQPLLYLSIYFKKHRSHYYDLLQLVRETGDWEEWIKFFLHGVIETANQAIETTQMIIKLFAEDREKIETLGKPAGSAFILYHYLQKNLITDAKRVIQLSNLTLPTTIKSFNYLIDLGIVKEMTGRARNKLYAYQKYIDILSEGAEVD